MAWLRGLSLHARLILIAGITGLAALLFAGWAIGDVLEGVVRRNLGEKLDAQVMMLARAVEPDGRVNPQKIVALPGFDRPGSPWGWRVQTAAGEWTGGSPIMGQELRPARHRHGGARRFGRARTPEGVRLHLVERRLDTPGGEARITAAGPRFIIERPLRAAMTPLLLSLALLGAGLAAATLVQLRYGLRPVRALRDDVAKVRSGAAAHLPEDQPKELRPLASEVNALIDQNAAGLESARNHVANLAHGLKTPLATLALRLEREGASADSRALVAQLDKRIGHHLRRARAAAGAVDRARCDIGAVSADLVMAMQHLNADKALEIATHVPAGTDVALDREDAEEMLGNLLDNACRFAVSRVTVSAAERGAQVALLIEDDGPGIAEDDLPRALHPGTRLDESGRGYGFGLSIVQELVALYGGSVSLARSEKLGGLAVTLLLPKRV